MKPRSEPAMASRPERRDPISRLARFCEIMALGLVAAALLMPFPNRLNRGGTEGAAITFQDVSGALVQAAVVPVHTRTTWVTLAIISTIVAVAAYQSRHAPKAHRVMLAGTIATLVVIGIHAAAQGYLQSRGPLRVEARTVLPGSDPSSALTVSSVTRVSLSEGTAESWQLLFAGDLLFSAPILLAWLLRSARRPTTPAS